MFIEKIWPYLPTPLVYAVVVGEAIAALLLVQNHAVLAVLFLWALVVAFVLGSWLISRPFHFERLVILITLAIAHVSLFADHIHDMYEFLHLHDQRSMMLARVGYSLVWLALTGAALVSYTRNSGVRVARIWPFVVGLALLACIFPIEPDAFIMSQPGWLWVLRIHIAFVTFLLVSVGDVMGVLIYEYGDRAQRRRSGHSIGVPDHHNIDISLVRTMVWSPMTLWIIFVPRILLPIALFILPYLLYTLVQRWYFAHKAHVSFLHLLADTFEGAHVIENSTHGLRHHNEEIISMITDNSKNGDTSITVMGTDGQMAAYYQTHQQQQQQTTLSEANNSKHRNSKRRPQPQAYGTSASASSIHRQNQDVRDALERF